MRRNEIHINITESGWFFLGNQGLLLLNQRLPCVCDSTLAKDQGNVRMVRLCYNNKNTTVGSVKAGADGGTPPGGNLGK